MPYLLIVEPRGNPKGWLRDAWKKRTLKIGQRPGPAREEQ